MTTLPPWPDRLTPDFVADYVVMLKKEHWGWFYDDEQETKIYMLQSLIESIARNECNSPLYCCQEAVKLWQNE